MAAAMDLVCGFGAGIAERAYRDRPWPGHDLFMSHENYTWSRPAIAVLLRVVIGVGVTSACPFTGSR